MLEGSWVFALISVSLFESYLTPSEDSKKKKEKDCVNFIHTPQV